ncbi:MAG: SH3 domain-containing protein [Pseudomonadota bacterium]
MSEAVRSGSKTAMNGAMNGATKSATKGVAARGWRMAMAALLVAGALPMLGLASGLSEAGAQSARGGSSGLPIPRYVSLKSNPVNVRRGPARDHEIAFVYEKAGLPVEVFGEYDNWRRIRDADGDEGWVYHALLSGRRTALVAPWLLRDETAEPVDLKASGSADARTVARLSPGVLADVEACDGRWCRLSGEGPSGTAYDGWMAQDQLFGVYPGEVVDD